MISRCYKIATTMCKSFSQLQRKKIRANFRYTSVSGVKATEGITERPKAKWANAHPLDRGLDLSGCLRASERVSERDHCTYIGRNLKVRICQPQSVSKCK